MNQSTDISDEKTGQLIISHFFKIDENDLLLLAGKTWNLRQIVVFFSGYKRRSMILLIFGFNSVHKKTLLTISSAV